MKLPDSVKTCTTALVLKQPKTASSVRTVFLARTVALALQKEKERQAEQKALAGESYQDYDLVFAHEDGRPYEERQIMEKLRGLEKEFQLTPVVFHSLRHCSTTVKLHLSGGDIKAVQGDTGHAQSRMVTDLYAHIDHEDRRQLAQKLETEFFQCGFRREEEKEKEDDQLHLLLKKNPELTKLLAGIVGAQG